MTARSRLRNLTFALIALGVSSARGQAPVEVVRVVDVALELPGLVGIATDRDLVRERLAPPVARRLVEGLPDLPDGVGIAAIEHLPDGSLLFAVDGWIQLEGVGVVGPADVLSISDGVTAVEFEGAAAGVPDGVAVDALARAGPDHLGISFDVPIPLGNASLDDEDLAMVLNGAIDYRVDLGALFPAGVDVDGLGFGAEEPYDAYFSFDSSLTLDGVTFDDEDIALWGDSGWTMIHDASESGGDWSGANLEAFSLFPGRIFADGFESEDTSSWSAVAP